MTMAISDTARRNHDELFGDRVSALAQTDPELSASVGLGWSGFQATSLHRGVATSRHRRSRCAQ
jgi:hypothetical protein